MTGMPAGGYAGDVSAQAAWDDLTKSSDATLIDVRSQPEWVYVGVPVLSSVGKETILVEWDDFVTRDRVPDFVGRLKAALEERGIGRDASSVVRLGDERVSRRHAELRDTDEGWLLVDLGSTSGTFVGGERVAELLIRRPTTVRFGGLHSTDEVRFVRQIRYDRGDMWGSLEAEKCRASLEVDEDQVENL